MNKIVCFALTLLIVLKSTSQNPILLKDINQGPNGCVEDWGTKSVQVKDKIFFVANDGSIPFGLHVIDNNNVVFLKDICHDCNTTPILMSYNEQVYFSSKENGK